MSKYKYGDYIGTEFNEGFAVLKGWIPFELAKKEIELELEVKVESVRNAYYRWGFVSDGFERMYGFYESKEGKGAFKGTSVKLGDVI